MKINKKLNKYVNEIIAIAGANDTIWDVGCNMFLANVKNYDQPDAPYYKGADLDWPEVAAELCDFYAGRVAALDREISEQAAQEGDKK